MNQSKDIKRKINLKMMDSGLFYKLQSNFMKDFANVAMESDIDEIKTFRPQSNNIANSIAVELVCNFLEKNEMNNTLECASIESNQSLKRKHDLYFLNRNLKYDKLTDVFKQLCLDNKQKSNKANLSYLTNEIAELINSIIVPSKMLPRLPSESDDDVDSDSEIIPTTLEHFGDLQNEKLLRDARTIRDFDKYNRERDAILERAQGIGDGQEGGKQGASHDATSKESKYVHKKTMHGRSYLDGKTHSLPSEISNPTIIIEEEEDYYEYVDVLQPDVLSSGINSSDLIHTSGTFVSLQDKLVRGRSKRMQSSKLMNDYPSGIKLGTAHPGTAQGTTPSVSTHVISSLTQNTSTAGSSNTPILEGAHPVQSSDSDILESRYPGEHTSSYTYTGSNQNGSIDSKNDDRYSKYNNLIESGVLLPTFGTQPNLDPKYPVGDKTSPSYYYTQHPPRQISTNDIYTSISQGSNETDYTYETVTVDENGRIIGKTKGTLVETQSSTKTYTAETSKKQEDYDFTYETITVDENGIPLKPVTLASTKRDGSEYHHTYTEDGKKGKETGIDGSIIPSTKAANSYDYTYETVTVDENNMPIDKKYVVSGKGTAPVIGPDGIINTGRDVESKDAHERGKDVKLSGNEYTQAQNGREYTQASIDQHGSPKQYSDLYMSSRKTARAKGATDIGPDPRGRLHSALYGEQHKPQDKDNEYTYETVTVDENNMPIEGRKYNREPKNIQRQSEEESSSSTRGVSKQTTPIHGVNKQTAGENDEYYTYTTVSLDENGLPIIPDKLRGSDIGRVIKQAAKQQSGSINTDSSNDQDILQNNVREETLMPPLKRNEDLHGDTTESDTQYTYTTVSVDDKGVPIDEETRKVIGSSMNTRKTENTNTIISDKNREAISNIMNHSDAPRKGLASAIRSNQGDHHSYDSEFTYTTVTVDENNMPLIDQFKSASLKKYVRQRPKRITQETLDSEPNSLWDQVNAGVDRKTRRSRSQRIQDMAGSSKFDDGGSPRRARDWDEMVNGNLPIEIPSYDEDVSLEENDKRRVIDLGPDSAAKSKFKKESDSTGSYIDTIDEKDRNNMKKELHQKEGLGKSQVDGQLPNENLQNHISNEDKQHVLNSRRKSSMSYTSLKQAFEMTKSNAVTEPDYNASTVTYTYLATSEEMKEKPKRKDELTFDANKKIISDDSGCAHSTQDGNLVKPTWDQLVSQVAVDNPTEGVHAHDLDTETPTDEMNEWQKMTHGKSGSNKIETEESLKIKKRWSYEKKETPPEIISGTPVNGSVVSIPTKKNLQRRRNIDNNEETTYDEEERIDSTWDEMRNKVYESSKGLNLVNPESAQREQQQDNLDLPHRERMPRYNYSEQSKDNFTKLLEERRNKDADEPIIIDKDRIIKDGEEAKKYVEKHAKSKDNHISTPLDPDSEFQETDESELIRDKKAPSLATATMNFRPGKQDVELESDYYPGYESDTVTVNIGPDGTMVRTTKDGHIIDVKPKKQLPNYTPKDLAPGSGMHKPPKFGKYGREAHLNGEAASAWEKMNANLIESEQSEDHTQESEVEKRMPKSAEEIKHEQSTYDPNQTYTYDSQTIDKPEPEEEPKVYEGKYYEVLDPTKTSKFAANIQPVRRQRRKMTVESSEYQSNSLEIPSGELDKESGNLLHKWTRNQPQYHIPKSEHIDGHLVNAVTGVPNGESVRRQKFESDNDKIESGDGNYQSIKTIKQSRNDPDMVPALKSGVNIGELDNTNLNKAHTYENEDKRKQRGNTENEGRIKDQAEGGDNESDNLLLEGQYSTPKKLVEEYPKDALQKAVRTPTSPHPQLHSDYYHHEDSRARTKKSMNSDYYYTDNFISDVSFSDGAFLSRKVAQDRTEKFKNRDRIIDENSDIDTYNSDFGTENQNNYDQLKSERKRKRPIPKHTPYNHLQNDLDIKEYRFDLPRLDKQFVPKYKHDVDDDTNIPDYNYIDTYRRPPNSQTDQKSVHSDGVNSQRPKQNSKSASAPDQCTPGTGRGISDDHRYDASEYTASGFYYNSEREAPKVGKKETGLKSAQLKPLPKVPGGNVDPQKKSSFYAMPYDEKEMFDSSFQSSETLETGDSGQSQKLVRKRGRGPTGPKQSLLEVTRKRTDPVYDQRQHKLDSDHKTELDMFEELRVEKRGISESLQKEIEERNAGKEQLSHLEEPGQEELLDGQRRFTKEERRKLETHDKPEEEKLPMIVDSTIGEVPQQKLRQRQRKTGKLGDESPIRHESFPNGDNYAPIDKFALNQSVTTGENDTSSLTQPELKSQKQGTKSGNIEKGTEVTTTYTYTYESSPPEERNKDIFPKREKQTDLPHIYSIPGQPPSDYGIPVRSKFAKGNSTSLEGSSFKIDTYTSGSNGTMKLLKPSTDLVDPTEPIPIDERNRSGGRQAAASYGNGKKPRELAKTSNVHSIESGTWESS